MLTSWLEGGIGNIFAPLEPEEKPTASGMNAFWRIVAPDPVYEQKMKALTAETEEIRLESPNQNHTVDAAVPPPSEAFLSPGFIQCAHCKKMTPVKSPPAPMEERDSVFKTPSPRETHDGYGETNAEGTTTVEQLVMSAAKATAESIISPPAVNEQRNKVFRLCASTTPLVSKLSTKLAKHLSNDKSLHKARASNLGMLVPEGLTPLMAAAHSGNVGAVKIILEADDSAHIDRDLQGRTAMHIASELGHTEVVEMLKKRYEKDGQPVDSLVDLTGRTPFGSCLTSPNPKAKKNRTQLEKLLFSPTDASLLGSPKPFLARQKICHSLNMAYAQSEMPGFRVIMEDALCSATWQNDSGELLCLLGVCDGHGDQGKVSHHVAEKIVPLIKEKTMQLNLSKSPTNWQELWTTVCLEVDSTLKERGLVGGSTGVFALTTRNEIVVANVGDSRCILIQQNQSAIEGGTNMDDTPPLVNESDSDSQQQIGSAQQEESPDASGQESREYVASAAEDTDSSNGAIHIVQEKNDDMGTNNKTNPVDEVTSTPRKDRNGQKNYVVVALSEDHKPDLDREKERIEKAGMSVIAETFEQDSQEFTIHKVQKSSSSCMAVSRSFGDFEYKKNKDLEPTEQGVIAVPDVRVHARNPGADLYLVMACDGIFDVMTSDDVANFIVNEIEHIEGERYDNGRLPKVGDKLLKECLDRGSKDNMSITIAALSEALQKFSGGALQGKALTFSPEEEATQLDASSV